MEPSVLAGCVVEWTAEVFYRSLETHQFERSLMSVGPLLRYII